MYGASQGAILILQTWLLTNADPLVKLTAETLQAIATVLGAGHEKVGAEAVMTIGQTASTAAIVLTFTDLGNDTTLLSAQTSYGYFELHNVTRYVPVEPDEVIFVGEEGERISGLVVGKQGTCSLFANVDRAILAGDLGKLEPSLLLAAMQLGLAEVVPA